MNYTVTYYPPADADGQPFESRPVPTLDDALDIVMDDCERESVGITGIEREVDPETRNVHWGVVCDDGASYVIVKL
ncbi:hypothetical protein SEA_BEAVER_109 [Gordonia phage Beaver]|uniref:Uncharacterized protein n=1 Tax=Gordonia phage Beaver TaxID=2591111 RepID=A0A515MJT4_9CAUD|nr:hypothetical protein HWC39_gp025 [Gordonia phage Beaver]QDM56923.1 hypothetical protein SEA_BEAVER_109 [Gordonia phage Beaver]